MQPDYTSNQNPLQDRNLYIIIGVTLIAIMGGQTIAPILPDLTQVFDVAPKEIELVMTIFFIPIGIATPILGLLADRIGIRKVLVPSLILFGIAGGFSSFADSFQTLLGWRFLQGLGAASLDSLALTMIAMTYRGKSLGIAMSVNASVIGISTAIYPLTGGALGGFSWRYPFLLSVVAFPLVMLIFMVLKLPQKPSRSQDDDLKSYLQTTWNSVNNPAVIGLLLAVCSLFIIQFGAFITYIPILAGVNFGASGLLNGLILASMSVALAIVASQLGWLAKQTSEITLIKIAFIIIATALLITPTINNAWLLIIPSILFGIGQALALPSSQALLAGLAAENSRAGFMAVNASVQSLGQAIGPVIAGISFGFWGMKGVFLVTAGISLATFVFFNILLTPKQELSPPVVQSETGINNLTTQNNQGYSPSEDESQLIPSITQTEDDDSYSPQIAAQALSGNTQIAKPSITQTEDDDSYSPQIAAQAPSDDTEIVRPSIKRPRKDDSYVPQIAAQAPSDDTEIVRPSIKRPRKDDSYVPQIATQAPSDDTEIVRPSIKQPAQEIHTSSPTVLQIQIAHLIHQSTQEVVELPGNIPLIYLGKPNKFNPPDIDLSPFPNSKVVSRKHAVIRVEGDHYYIQDLGSANGTYINRYPQLRGKKYPLLPGNWYKLHPGNHISFGKGELITFVWQIYAP